MSEIVESIAELPSQHCLTSYFDGEWHLWIEHEAGTRDGICLAVGPVGSQVLREGIAVLEGLLGAARGALAKVEASAEPPPVDRYGGLNE